MPRDTRARPLATSVARALGALGVIVLDLIAAAGPWPLPVTGLLDEPAHLLTAWLALCVLAGSRRQAWPWVFLGVLAIDLDHLPLYLWGGPVAQPGGRPVTHSLITPLVLLALACAVPRWRRQLGALAAGVLLHFVRDVATGPGLPLLWPLPPDRVLLPYWTYLLVVMALATAAVRGGYVRDTRPRTPDPTPHD